MKKLFLLPLAILLVIGFILTACNQTDSTSQPTSNQPTATQPAATQPTATQPTATQSATSTATNPVAKKTLTMGLVCDLTGTIGNQVMNIQNLLADMYNAEGGIKVGNDYYMMKIITYSDDAQATKAVSAANRLVFQDKVKFILFHSGASDLVLPITDPEKVISFSNAAIWNSGFLDKWKYSFCTLGQGTHQVSVAGWLAENRPEIKDTNGVAFAFPDNAAGHQQASLVSYPYRCLGCNAQIVYFPADQRDLSSLGTKIAVMNPKWFMGNVGKIEDMALASSAAYDAGYRGNYFSFMTSDIGLLAPVFKPEVLEGYINACSAMEVNPAASQLAADMKNAWIAKYGQWDYPDYMTSPSNRALIAAIQKAGSIEVDAVANALHQGLDFTVPDGDGYMITRPDMRLDGSCVDAVTDHMLKQIRNKQVNILATFNADQSFGYVRKAYPPLAPGQTPTIVTPQ